MEEITTKTNQLQYENVNIKKSCRICLSQFDLGISLFEPNETLNDKTAVSLIWNCFGIKIFKNNDLPNEICNECASNILQSHNFKIQLQQNQKLLKSQCLNGIEVKKPRSITKIEDNVYRVNINDVDENDRELDQIANGYLDVVHNLEINHKVELEKDDVLIIVAEKPSSEEASKHVVQNMPENMEEASKWLKLAKQSGPPYKCKLCNRIYQSKYPTFYAHVRSHFATKIQCALCPLKYLPGRESYHMRTHTREKPYKCLTCDRAFSMKNHLNRHLKLRCNVAKESKCRICESVYPTFKLMRKHLLKDHDLCRHEQAKGECAECCKEIENKNMCEYCGLKVLRYNRHLNICKAAPIETRFQLQNATTCSECGELVLSENEYKSHMKKHLNTRTNSYNCGQCGKVFRKKQYLKDHMEIHEPGNYPCPICGKSFKRKILLKLHRHTHSSIKKHECSICHKLFRVKDHLTKHLAVHTKNKPFVCKVCNKGFSWKGNLNQHLLVHLENKYFSCEICQKTFTIQGNLWKHMESH